MIFLLDTNILLRLGSTSHSQYAEVSDSVELLKSKGHSLVILPQVLYEYWVVATRPLEQNGRALSPQQVAADTDTLCLLFTLLPDEHEIYPIWNELVRKNQVIGKSAHDARLVAAMMHHQIRAILTFNKRDFARFTSIAVATPSEILAGREV